MKVTEDEHYWDRIRAAARFIKGDHCTGVVDWFRDCCDRHDVEYYYAADIDGNKLTRAEADLRMRECIQARSGFKRWSIIAWDRWIGCRIGGWFFWWKHRRRERKGKR